MLTGVLLLTVIAWAALYFRLLAPNVATYCESRSPVLIWRISDNIELRGKTSVGPSGSLLS